MSSESDAAAMAAKLAAQAALVRDLKSSPTASKADIDAAVKQLLELKAALEPVQKAAQAKNAAPADSGDADAQKKANIAKAEAEKAAAREKKRAAAAAKKDGAPDAAAPVDASPPPADTGAKAKGAPGGMAAAAAPATQPAASAAVKPPPIVLGNKELQVRHHASASPVLSFLASKLGGLTVHFGTQAEPGVVCFVPQSHGGGRLEGDVTIARYFATLAHPARGLAGPPPPPLAPADAASGLLPPPEHVAHARELARLEEWLSGPAAGALREASAPALAELDATLAMRTYLVGHEASLADAVAYAALAANGAWATLKGSKEGARALPHLSRWHAHLSGLPAFSAADLAYLGAKSVGGSFKIDLPGAERGKVVMRFAPEPSGFLHIGHAKAALLGKHFASEFEGTLILRFDDTNPSKEKEEYEAAIIADVHRLGLCPDRVTRTSDYFDALIEAQRAMIGRGEAYVDPSPAEEQQKGRFAKAPSPFRDSEVSENLRLFQEMLIGSEEGVKCCVRAKMDPASDNGTLRDPTTYRCNATPHHSTGERYKAYPTYDFACPWVDAHEGVTHALRDRQYKDRDAQYVRMGELQRVRRVELWSFSRMNFKMCLLSKRKLQWFVETGRVSGWDDPRMPTIQGILRRGLSVEGLRYFILLQGASQNSNLMEWDKIWAENRKIIDCSAKRYAALPAADAAVFELLAGEAAEDVPPTEVETRSLLAHKKAPELGNKCARDARRGARAPRRAAPRSRGQPPFPLPPPFAPPRVRPSSRRVRARRLKWYGPRITLDQADAALLVEGEEVTLMDWGNARVVSLARDAATGLVTGGRAQLHTRGDVKATKKKLTWLAADAHNVAAELIDLDHLINKDSLDEDEKLDVRARRAARARRILRGEMCSRAHPPCTPRARAPPAPRPSGQGAVPQPDDDGGPPLPRRARAARPQARRDHPDRAPRLLHLR